jgi:hypothetical protein
LIGVVEQIRGFRPVARCGRDKRAVDRQIIGEPG